MFNIPIIQILAIFILLNLLLTRELPFLISAIVQNPLIGLSMIIGLVAGITIHEASHAYVAYRLGDPTAKLEGRMTLNPMAHMDPVGTVALLFIGIGWGKPTPFDPFNLRNIKRDSALISVAGAASNFALALALSIPYLIAYWFQMLSPTINTIYLYLSPVIFFNVVLAVFNLIPVAPLDGFKVLAGILPREWYADFMQMEKYGIFILLLLLVTGAVGQILFPVTSTIFALLIPGLTAPF
ncbi:MAG: site-2 protease family protein [Candidatus Curtissbacteria bacterium]|nr:site-2 protease family protein [Candidatus Curtissbacteria bacterium]